MVKLRIHSSVATLEAHKSKSEVETNCYKHKKNTIEVIPEWFLTTRTAATTPRMSKFTLKLLRIRAFFKCSPMFASLFLKDEKGHGQTVFNIVNYIQRKT